MHIGCVELCTLRGWCDCRLVGLWRGNWSDEGQWASCNTRHLPVVNHELVAGAFCVFLRIRQLTSAKVKISYWCHIEICSSRYLGLLENVASCMNSCSIIHKLLMCWSVGVILLAKHVHSAHTRNMLTMHACWSASCPFVFEKWWPLGIGADAFRCSAYSCCFFLKWQTCMQLPVSHLWLLYMNDVCYCCHHFVNVLPVLVASKTLIDSL